MADINTEKLRNDLKDYYGTAMAGPFPAAVIDLARVERASEQELVRMAKNNRFDLRKYLK